MKELEARLAQVETQLIAEKQSTSVNTASVEADWNSLGMDLDEQLLDPAFDISQPGFGLDAAPSMQIGDFRSFELISLGLQEPLPPQDMIDEL